MIKYDLFVTDGFFVCQGQLDLYSKRFFHGESNATYCCMHLTNRIQLFHTNLQQKHKHVWFEVNATEFNMSRL